MSGSAGPALDRDSFKHSIQVPALRVPKQRCNELMKKLRGFTFERPKTRCIVADGSSTDTRLLLLAEGLQQNALKPELQQLLSQEGLVWSTHELLLGYDNMATEAVLKRLLPPNVEVPSSFEGVGRIAHLNLKEELLPYKHLIGQVIIDKNPQITTVVNKLGSIENEYRVFDMEVVAGQGDAAAGLETEVVQHGTRFRLDFTKVYWNSRLETEHHRLVNSFQPHEVVVDIMAGIGPFAVPAALYGCRVYANDLNPASARYLAANVRLNKVGRSVDVFNMDGRAFVRLLLGAPGAAAAAAPPAAEGAELPQAQQPTSERPAAQTAQQQQQQGAGSSTAPPSDQGGNGAASPASAGHPPQAGHGAQPGFAATTAPAGQLPPMPPGFCVPAGGLGFHHAIMNLPASAVEFLDAFSGAFDPAVWAGRQLPLVHCYTFMKGETEQDVLARVEAALGGTLDHPPAIHHVRDVAPGKVMLCVSFRVPRGVAFAGRAPAGAGQPAAAPAAAAVAAAGGGDGEQAAKKQRTFDGV